MSGSTSVRRLERAALTGEHPYADPPPDRAKRVDATGALTIFTTRSGTVREGSPDAAALLNVQRLEGKLLIAFVARRDTRTFRDWLRALGRADAPRSISVLLRPRGRKPFRAHLSVTRVWDAETMVGLRWTISPVASEEKATCGQPIEAAAESSARPVSASASEEDLADFELDPA